jgi:hypothetical protein
MPLCTACDVVADIEAGKFKDVPFEKTPCAKCHFTGTVQHNHGHSHVSFESFISNSIDTAAPDPDEDDAEAAPDTDDPPEVPTDPDDAGILPDRPDHAVLIHPESDEPAPFVEISDRAAESFRDFFSEWLRLTPLCQQIIAVRLAEPDLKNNEIAARLDTTPQHVSQFLRTANTKSRAFECLTKRRNRKLSNAPRMLKAS